MNSQDIILVVDPRVKSSDRNLYQELLSFSQRYHWECNESPKSNTIRLQVIITMAFDGHFSKTNEANKVYIKIKEKNLNLFNQDSDLENSLVISLASELEDFLPLINDVNTNLKKLFLSRFQSQEKRMFKSLATKKSIEADLYLVQKLIEFHHYLFSKEILDYFEITHIQSSLTKAYKKDVALLKWFEVSESEFDGFLDFSDIGYFDYVLVWNKSVNPIGLYSTLKELFTLKMNLIVEKGHFKLEQEVFYQIKIPVILFDKNDEPVLYNHAYTDLNIPFSECLFLSDGKMVSASNSSYTTIVRTYLEQRAYVFIPLDQTYDKKEKSQDELGIISSSIAHELNNPLGGILAAIEVLSLDDLKDDILEELKIMKQGVFRIRKLAQTFLGFSKSSHDYLNQNPNLKECFQQAVELTRFRLIEGNLVLDIDINERAENMNIKNESFLTMLLYLVLGEIVTQTERRGLVENKMAKKIEVRLEIFKREFYIKCSYVDHIYANCIESKLLNYLLNNLNIKLQKNEKRISFISLN